MKNAMISVIVCALFLIGCASTAGNLQRATAKNVETSLMSSDYEVSNINRKTTSVSWSAKSKDGKCYECEADDMVRDVNCTEVKCND